MYQQTASSLAARRTNRARGVRAPAPRHPQMLDGFRAVAKRLLESVPDLNAYERGFLRDAARDEYRYGHTALTMFVLLSQRSVRPEDRELLAEEVRRASRPCRACGNVHAVFDRETEAQGRADVAQRRFEQHPSPANREACRLALLAQAATTREALDVVETGV